MVVGVPKGVVHGYKNIGDIDGMVINARGLYMSRVTGSRSTRSVTKMIRRRYSGWIEAGASGRDRLI